MAGRLWLTPDGTGAYPDQSVLTPVTNPSNLVIPSVTHYQRTCTSGSELLHHAVHLVAVSPDWLTKMYASSRKIGQRRSSRSEASSKLTGMSVSSSTVWRQASAAWYDVPHATNTILLLRLMAGSKEVEVWGGKWEGGAREMIRSLYIEWLEGGNWINFAFAERYRIEASGRALASLAKNSSMLLPMAEASTSGFTAPSRLVMEPCLIPIIRGDPLLAATSSPG
ncbi:MAG: hypothetical protein FRX49_11953 [Trebouxia sp. A1-2]|nr:MAG: hypothetical protein FRX49_11953 [Trebouxia sp. A1-2]